MGDGNQRKILFIINGSTAPVHLYNVERSIQGVRSEAPTDKPYEIVVLSPEKPKQAVEQYATPTAANLQRLTSGLSSKLNDGDFLVLHVTGEGKERYREYDGQKEGCVALQNSCYSFDQLRKDFDKLKYGQRFVMMDFPNSKRALPLFATNKTNAITFGPPDGTFGCDLPRLFFWQDKNKIPDQNKDGKINIRERFDYATFSSNNFCTLDFFNILPSLSLSGESAPDPEESGPRPELSPILGNIDSLIKQLYQDTKAVDELKQILKQNPSLKLPVLFSLIRKGEEDNKLPDLNLIFTEKQDLLPYTNSLIEDPDPKIRKIAVKAYSELSKSSEHSSFDKWGTSWKLLEDQADVTPLLNRFKQESDPMVISELIDALAAFDESAISALPRIIQLSQNLKIRKRGIAYYARRVAHTDEARTTEFASFLKPLLKEKDLFIRWNTMIALGSIKDRSAVPLLIERLEDDNKSAIVAMTALVEIGDKTVIPILRKILENKDKHIAGFAAVALGRFGDETAVPFLIKNLENSLFVKATIYTIVKLESETGPVVTALTKALEDENHSILIMLALANIGAKSSVAVSDIAKKFLAHKNSKTRLYAAKSLGLIGDTSAVNLLAKQLKSEEDDEVKKVIIEALALIGKSTHEAESVLIKKISDPEKEIASLAIDTLGRIGKEITTVDWLTRTLQDIENESPRIRAASAKSLGHIAARNPILIFKVLPMLSKAMNDENSSVKVAAIEAIKGIVQQNPHYPSGGLFFLPHLLPAVDQPKSKSSKTDYKKEIPAFIKQLKSKKPEWRENAALALEKIGDPSVIPALKERLIEEDDHEVSFAIVKALRVLSPEKPEVEPDRDGDSIPDIKDGCPDLAGPSDPDPMKNGCPLILRSRSMIRPIKWGDVQSR